MDSERNPSQTTLCDEEKFKDLADVDTEEHFSSPLNPPRKRIHHILILTLVATTIFLIPIAYLSASTWTTSSRLQQYDQCGTSAAEARSRGCVFEATGFTWLPPSCHDAETETEFLAYVADHDLKLYHDYNYTREVSAEEVARGDGDGYFVREGYHLAHCLFLFKKLHRAYANKRVIDGYIISLNHTEHCVEQSLSVGRDKDYRKDVIQFSYTKWPYCGRPGGYNLIWAKQGEWTDY
ncbi:hypothetical protein N0V83_010437 [Neocucurbitaria cava]|uniref:Major facilitator superfamily transporter protein n=1 Tax=Neocucurbitaria cava TaxID=798079 RepID=A0A9W8XXL3_9PLEO|nr:hypothetical protein N0V83_010437 [Neocucurbitaria cava]